MDALERRTLRGTAATRTSRTRFARTTVEGGPWFGIRSFMDISGTLSLAPSQHKTRFARLDARRLTRVDEERGEVSIRSAEAASSPKTLGRDVLWTTCDTGDDGRGEPRRSPRSSSPNTNRMHQKMRIAPASWPDDSCCSMARDRAIPVRPPSVVARTAWNRMSPRRKHDAFFISWHRVRIGRRAWRPAAPLDVVACIGHVSMKTSAPMSRSPRLLRASSGR